MIEKRPAGRTQRLGPSYTSRLGGARRLRTLPFSLADVGPAPAGFSARRFSPKSTIKRLGSVEMEIIESPAETLGDAAELALVEIHRLTAEHSPFHAGTYMYRHLAQATTLIVLRHDGEVVGFSLATSLEAGEHPCLFINASFYAPTIRGGHLTARVNLWHIWRAVWKHCPRLVYVAYRTQNPLAFAAGVSTAPFHPRPDQAAPRRVKAAAAALSRALNPEAVYDAEAMVQRGILARDGIDPNPARHHDPAINAFCDEHLDYQGGDLFLLVAEMNVPAVAKMAWVNWRKAVAKRKRA